MGLGVSINGGTPKSSILNGIFPYKPTIVGGIPIYGTLHMDAEFLAIDLSICCVPPEVSMQSWCPCFAVRRWMRRGLKSSKKCWEDFEICDDLWIFKKFSLYFETFF